MPTTPKKALTPSGSNAENEAENALVLVSEFPPPPFYYSISNLKLIPPPIPTNSLLCASRQAAAVRAAAQEQVERNRLKALQEDAVETIWDGNDTSTKSLPVKNVASERMISETTNFDITNNQLQTEIDKTQKGHEVLDPSDLGETAVVKSSSTSVVGSTGETNQQSEISAALPMDDGEFVAVFGEIVEDPLLAPIEDGCNDPTKIRDELNRLNNKVLGGFVELVRELVTALANQKCRDQLAHHIFLMLQECNKFREHQAREILIECLEEQQRIKKEAVTLLKKKIVDSNASLEKLEHVIQRQQIRE